jgi:hypothetical protein
MASELVLSLIEPSKFDANVGLLASGAFPNSPVGIGFVLRAWRVCEGASAFLAIDGTRDPLDLRDEDQSPPCLFEGPINGDLPGLDGGAPRQGRLC